MIEFTVKTLDSQNHHLSVETDAVTILELKQKIQAQIGIDISLQRLIFCGKLMADTSFLSQYDVAGKVIHCVQRPPPHIERMRPRPPRRQNTRTHISAPLLSNTDPELVPRHLDPPTFDDQQILLAPNNARIEFVHRLVQEMLRQMGGVQELARFEQMLPRRPARRRRASRVTITEVIEPMDVDVLSHADNDMRPAEEIHQPQNTSRFRAIQASRPQGPADLANAFEQFERIFLDSATIRNIFLFILRLTYDDPQNPIDHDTRVRYRTIFHSITEMFHSFAHCLHTISDFQLEFPNENGPPTLVSDGSTMRPLPMNATGSRVLTTEAHRVPVNPRLPGAETVTYPVDVETRLPFPLVTEQRTIDNLQQQLSEEQRRIPDNQHPPEAATSEELPPYEEDEPIYVVNVPEEFAVFLQMDDTTANRLFETVAANAGAAATQQHPDQEIPEGLQRFVQALLAHAVQQSLDQQRIASERIAQIQASANAVLSRSIMRAHLRNADVGTNNRFISAGPPPTGVVPNNGIRAPNPNLSRGHVPINQALSNIINNALRNRAEEDASGPQNESSDNDANAARATVNEARNRQGAASANETNELASGYSNGAGNVASRIASSGNVASGIASSGNVASGIASSGNVASGIASSRNFASGISSSGNLASGNASARNVASEIGAAGNLASGIASVGNVAYGIGAARNVASGIGAAGNIASGIGAAGNLASGIGAAGNVASGIGAARNVASGIEAAGNVASGIASAGNIQNRVNNNSGVNNAFRNFSQLDLELIEALHNEEDRENLQNVAGAREHVDFSESIRQVTANIRRITNDSAIGLDNSALDDLSNNLREDFVNNYRGLVQFIRNDLSGTLNNAADNGLNISFEVRENAPANWSANVAAVSHANVAPVSHANLAAAGHANVAAVSHANVAAVSQANDAGTNSGVNRENVSSNTNRSRSETLDATQTRIVTLRRLLERMNNRQNYSSSSSGPNLRPYIPSQSADASSGPASGVGAAAMSTQASRVSSLSTSGDETLATAVPSQASNIDNVTTSGGQNLTAAMASGGQYLDTAFAMASGGQSLDTASGMTSGSQTLNAAAEMPTRQDRSPHATCIYQPSDASNARPTVVSRVGSSGTSGYETLLSSQASNVFSASASGGQSLGVATAITTQPNYYRFTGSTGGQTLTAASALPTRTLSGPHTTWSNQPSGAASARSSEASRHGRSSTSGNETSFTAAMSSQASNVGTVTTSGGRNSLSIIATVGALAPSVHNLSATAGALASGGQNLSATAGAMASSGQNLNATAGAMGFGAQSINVASAMSNAQASGTSYSGASGLNAAAALPTRQPRSFTREPEAAAAPRRPAREARDRRSANNDSSSDSETLTDPGVQARIFLQDFFRNYPSAGPRPPVVPPAPSAPLVDDLILENHRPIVRSRHPLLDSDPEIDGPGVYSIGPNNTVQRLGSVDSIGLDNAAENLERRRRAQPSEYANSLSSTRRGTPRSNIPEPSASAVAATARDVGNARQRMAVSLRRNQNSRTNIPWSNLIYDRFLNCDSHHARNYLQQRNFRSVNTFENNNTPMMAPQPLRADSIINEITELMVGNHNDGIIFIRHLLMALSRQLNAGDMSQLINIRIPDLFELRARLRSRMYSIYADNAADDNPTLNANIIQTFVRQLYPFLRYLNRLQCSSIRDDLHIPRTLMLLLKARLPPILNLISTYNFVENYPDRLYIACLKLFIELTTFLRYLANDDIEAMRTIITNFTDSERSSRIPPWQRLLLRYLAQYFHVNRAQYGPTCDGIRLYFCSIVQRVYDSDSDDMDDDDDESLGENASVGEDSDVSLHLPDPGDESSPASSPVVMSSPGPSGPVVIRRRRARDTRTTASMTDLLRGTTHMSTYEKFILTKKSERGNLEPRVVHKSRLPAPSTSYSAPSDGQNQCTLPSGEKGTKASELNKAKTRTQNGTEQEGEENSEDSSDDDGDEEGDDGDEEGEDGDEEGEDGEDDEGEDEDEEGEDGDEEGEDGEDGEEEGEDGGDEEESDDEVEMRMEGGAAGGGFGSGDGASGGASRSRGSTDQLCEYISGMPDRKRRRLRSQDTLKAVSDNEQPLLEDEMAHDKDDTPQNSQNGSKDKKN